MAKHFVNKNAIKAISEFFRPQLGHFTKFWEFHDICQDFLCLGSSHTDTLVGDLVSILFRSIRTALATTRWPRPRP